MICMASRPKVLPPTLHTSIKKPMQPFNVVNVDLLYLPKFKQLQATSVIIVVDAYTKWIEVAPLANTKS